MTCIINSATNNNIKALKLEDLKFLSLKNIKTQVFKLIFLAPSTYNTSAYVQIDKNVFFSGD